MVGRGGIGIAKNECIDQKSEGQNGRFTMSKGGFTVRENFSEKKMRERGTDRFRPHTAQLQLCFCCSFIFFRTASFSTLTRFLRSSSPRPSQNSLMRSLSSVEDVLQILLFLADWVLAGAFCLVLCGPEAFEEGGDG